MRQILLCSAALGALALSGCNQPSNASRTPSDPAEFLKAAETELMEYSEYAGRVGWVNQNFITDDTDWLNSRAGSEGTQLSVRLANETKSFEGKTLAPDQQRKMNKLRSGIVMPAPSSGTPQEAKAIADELADITTRMQSTYGKHTFPIGGKDLNIDDLSDIVETPGNPQKIREAWEGWRTVSMAPQSGAASGETTPSMAADYARMVEIGNAGAKELGFANVGGHVALQLRHACRRHGEAKSSACGRRSSRSTNELHCYVRAGLNAKYGDARTGQDRADPRRSPGQYVGAGVGQASIRHRRSDELATPAMTSPPFSSSRLR